MPQATDIKHDFLTNLGHLYDEIEMWLKGSSLTTAKTEIGIREEEFGNYTAHSFLIRKGEKPMASLRPIGASIIGARGRVDLEGRSGKEIISLLEEGGPTLAISVGPEGGPREANTRRLYKGVTEPGWYWIESRSLGRARKLTKDVFFDLLQRVSSHAIGE